MKQLFIFLPFIVPGVLLSQGNNAFITLSGNVIADHKPLEYAIISISGTQMGATTDSTGFYRINNIPRGSYQVQVNCIGFNTLTRVLHIHDDKDVSLNIDFTNSENKLNEVVVTGTLKEVSRIESPVTVEVFKPAFFKRNPTPNIFDALQNVNGVKPQINCNVCNTGDIHINGLEGPFTMVLIDGMPIVSSLSTVYGLSGIPNSLVERIEIVKGPASSLYGSEAVGGLINIITKRPEYAPAFSADVMSTSYHEHNADLGFKSKIGKKIIVLNGINYFTFQNRVDKNHDLFTDVTLQNRLSVFQKWNFERSEHRIFSLAARSMYEDRWGGDKRWEKKYRGGDSIYGESIYTKRWELLGNYQLPVKEKLMLSFSYNHHDQDSRYGTTSYIARQSIAFGQITWDKKIGVHDLLFGTALRYTWYDDNTPATRSGNAGMNPQNQPQSIWLPGVFFQNEISIGTRQRLLLGLRYDHNSYHGNIFTPRLAYKYSIDDENIFRVNAGTGFRLVNLFTEDHAALTGARTVEVKNKLNPERSYNVNCNYIKKIYTVSGTFIGIDASLFYTFFNNRIIGDYDTNPNKIIYDNLNGHAISQGVSLNMDITFQNGMKMYGGGTYMENTLTQNGRSEQQILTEKFTAVWALSYKFNKLNLSMDYTGNVYSPMRLPLLSDTDPRKDKSPWWSIQNLQLTYSGMHLIEIYGGIKNLLNWTPNKGNPFIIARANDPFDKEVQFGGNGQVLATANNPYALTFDPTYVYAPNQGIRAFLGFRYSIK